MSVEQTTQIIQLVLNSVLMVLACAFVLGGLLLRRSVLENRLQATSIEYFQILHRLDDSRHSSNEALQHHRLLFLKKRLRHLQHHVKASRTSILGLYYALMVFAASVFALSLRTVFSASWLVSGAMALFMVGVAVLLASVALVVLDLHQSENPFWQEMRDTLMQGKAEIREFRGRRSTHQPESPRRIKAS
ncbi:hypothetical protein [Myxacorys almedinensis]|uniref:DUF2721 domain-containing protein n=1 Tax=Myxacorys almedinensis A TaxID=2690445 RepID=A0A8J7YX86_9CYAN|nr:hypothetical protein [Myxacorys almedinensis]NDJ16332.1 hypothetical protein [Myxacorys almedinensis A]